MCKCFGNTYASKTLAHDPAPSLFKMLPITENLNKANLKDVCSVLFINKRFALNEMFQ